jgi:hypothetical protein
MMFDEQKKQQAIEQTIKTWLIPRARELRETGEFVPTAFLFTEHCAHDHEGPCVATMILSDQGAFHTQQHKDQAAAMITAAARKIGAWGVLVVCDTDYWNLYPDAHKRVGMTAEEFKKRAASDYDWLCKVRDRVGDHLEALSFQFETYCGDWSGVLVYKRDDTHGFIWHPLAESEPGALQQEGRFACLLPPPRTGVGHA